MSFLFRTVDLEGFFYPKMLEIMTNHYCKVGVCQDYKYAAGLNIFAWPV